MNKEPKKLSLCWGISPLILGTVLCLTADTLYGFSYFFVRWLTTLEDVPSDWILCFKELTTVLVTFPIVLILFAKRKCSLPSLRLFLLICLAAIFCELVGTRFHIMALASIGILLATPLVQTFTILLAVLIGAFFLRERFTLWKLFIMSVLVTAIFCFSFSQSEGVGINIQVTPLFLAGLGAALVTGFGYSMYSILLRSLLKQDPPESDQDKGTGTPSLYEEGNKEEGNDASSPAWAPLECKRGSAERENDLGEKANDFENRPGEKGVRTSIDGANQRPHEKEPVSIFFIMTVVCLFGSLLGASFLFHQKGISGFYQVPTVCWLLILLAGLTNVGAFYLKNLSFRFVTVSKVSFLTVWNIVVGTMLGILFLNESMNLLTSVGLVLTILGVMLASRIS